MEVGFDQTLLNSTKSKSRFERDLLADDNDPLLAVQDPAVVRPRGRPRGSENRRQQVFEASTLQEPSLFERIEAEIADLQGGEVAPDVEAVVHRADPAPGRGRGRERGRGRGRGVRARGQGQGQRQESGRGQEQGRGRGRRRGRASRARGAATNQEGAIPNEV